MNFKLNTIICVLFLTSFFYSFSASGLLEDVSESKVFVPISDSLSADSIYANMLQSSDVVFEGTVLDAKFYELDGQRYFEETYQVHKVFKGNLESETVKIIKNCESAVKSLENELPWPYNQNVVLYPLPIGMNGLFLADYGLEDNNESLVINDLDSSLEVSYNSVNTKIYAEDSYKHFFVYHKIEGYTLAFEKPKDLYYFVFKSLHSSSFIDITSKEFSSSPPPPQY